MNTINVQVYAEKVFAAAAETMNMPQSEKTELNWFFSMEIIWAGMDIPVYFHVLAEESVNKDTFAEHVQEQKNIIEKSDICRLIKEGTHFLDPYYAYLEQLPQIQ